MIREAKSKVLTCRSIQDSSSSENFCYRSDSSPESSLKFFQNWNPQESLEWDRSSEMNLRQNEEGPSLYNQFPLH